MSPAYTPAQVDHCFRLRVDDHDPYNESFGAGPTLFWQAVAEHLGGTCLLLRWPLHAAVPCEDWAVVDARYLKVLPRVQIRAVSTAAGLY